jgi:hypothetical protein
LPPNFTISRHPAYSTFPPFPSPLPLHHAFIRERGAAERAHLHLGHTYSFLRFAISMPKSLIPICSKHAGCPNSVKNWTSKHGMKIYLRKGVNLSNGKFLLDNSGGQILEKSIKTLTLYRPSNDLQGFFQILSPRIIERQITLLKLHPLEFVVGKFQK